MKDGQVRKMDPTHEKRDEYVESEKLAKLANYKTNTDQLLYKEQRLGNLK